MKKIDFYVIVWMFLLLFSLVTFAGCALPEGAGNSAYSFAPVGSKESNGITGSEDSKESGKIPKESEPSESGTVESGKDELSEEVASALELLREDRSVTVSSGRESIHPLAGLVYTEIYDETSGTWLNGCGAGVYPYLEARRKAGITSAETRIPCLTLNGTVSVLLPVNGSVQTLTVIDLYDPEYKEIQTTLEGLSKLPAGEYEVILRVLESGNCDSDLPQNKTCEEKVFRLYVGYAHFSFDADQKTWGDQPVVKEGFVNTGTEPILSVEDAMRLGRKEATVTYDSVRTAHDTVFGIWRVLFYTEDVPGGCQTVYLYENGKTIASVYGE